MSRTVAYVSGTRADFGLMESTLRTIDAHPGLSLRIFVTGMHLSPRHGNTVAEIEASGLPIMARVATPMETGERLEMALGFGDMLGAMARTFAVECPDILLLLGDRGEMLAGALAALHLNIPVAHIHGGERSGTIDEPMRHAISKLSHYHFTATQAAGERLVRMGEDPATVFVTGAPGLDDLVGFAPADRSALAQEVGLDPEQPICLMIFHPVVQQAEAAGQQAAVLLGAIEQRGLQALVFQPNADAGSQHIRAMIADRAPGKRVAVVEHLHRPRYLSWLAAADVVLGNSSSGILETASFGTPTVNVGDRQQGRERNANVIDAPLEEPAVAAALERALASGRLAPANIYGDGQAGRRITEKLASVSLDTAILNKMNFF